MEKKEKLEQLLKTLPELPGIYQYLDAPGNIIYIGKAKNLKKRVSSYFTRDVHENGKTRVLVNKIEDIKYMVVETELDALLLENNLIKKYQPRYNVLLKDDKTFPWICIKNEPFPRVFSTRNPVKDGSFYYGPFGSVKQMQTLMEFIKQIFPLRTCNLNLSGEQIAKKKYSICLEYHLGKCLGPCAGYQDKTDYDQSIKNIREIIKGNIAGVTRHMQGLMRDYSARYEFEKAQELKEKIEILEKFQSKSTIVNPSINNVDVFSIECDENHGFVNFLKIINGSIIQGHTMELVKKLDESREELLQLAIVEIRERFKSDSNEILVPFDPGFDIPNVKFLIPQRGDKKHLLDLSVKNVSYYKKEKDKKEELVDPERHTRRILSQMAMDLRMKELPSYIECFDNSNFQGTDPVAACVVFKNAKPSKKDYRHFNIKTVVGPDDFASMEEVIFRRYKKLLDEGSDLPQLIIVDGGKGQLSSALISLERLQLRGKITIIGIAKRLEEIYYPDDSVPMYLDKRSETLKIIQQLRNEAHRFGITHHRKRRTRNTLKTELTEIPGISEISANKLLKDFKSVKRIREAGMEELAKIVGRSKANEIIKYFLNQQSVKLGIGGKY